MFDFEFLNSHLKPNHSKLPQIAFQILMKTCDFQSLDLSESEKLIVTKLLREFKKMSQLNLERLTRTFRLGNLEQPVIQFIMQNLKQIDESVQKQDILVYDQLNRLDYQMIQKMEWKVDVQIQSDSDKKPKVFVILNIQTENDRLIYKLDPKQFEQFRLQVAQLYYESIDN